MKVSEYKNMFEHEDGHFFYVSTHQLVISIIQIINNNKKRELYILDAGCGTGALAKKMEDFGKVEGVDFSKDALFYAKKRGANVQQASIEKLPFKSNTFDVVVSIDVLTSKSIVDDLIPLREFHRVLKKGGVLIIRVSANKWLHLIHDDHVHMARRYSKKELHTKLTKIGFEVKKLSFIHSVLFPLIVLRFIWERISQPKDTESAINTVNPVVNRIACAVLLAEVKLFLSYDIPFGLGLISIAKKK